MISIKFFKKGLLAIPSLVYSSSTALVYPPGRQVGILGLEVSTPRWHVSLDQIPLSFSLLLVLALLPLLAGAVARWWKIFF